MLIKIMKKRIEECWRTPCDKRAVVTQIPDGTATLAVFDNGVKEFEQTYSSRKGAVIAMGKRYGKCSFCRMVDVLSSQIVE